MFLGVTLLVTLGVCLNFREDAPPIVRVLDVPGWRDLSDSGPPPYAWVSDTVVFACPSKSRIENPFLYDTVTHQTSQLTQLQRTLDTEKDLYVNSWAISPDGKRLLWDSVFSCRIGTARLDGSDLQITSALPASTSLRDVSWLDSNRWITFGFDEDAKNLPKFFGGDVRSPGVVRVLSGTQYSEALPLPRIEGFGLESSRSPVAVVTRSNRNPSIFSRDPLNAPPGTEAVQAVISNRRDRVGWLVTSLTEAPFAEIARLLPDQKHVEIWVSRLDGENMRRMGSMIVPNRVILRDLPGSLQWLPSDHAISFVYDSTIWVATDK